MHKVFSKVSKEVVGHPHNCSQYNSARIKIIPFCWSFKSFTDYFQIKQEKSWVTFG